MENETELNHEHDSIGKVVLGDVALNETKIQEILNRKYIGNCKYKVANVYVFRYDWETDYFVQKQNGYCYEFEIKTSKADFLADFKKTTKHTILKSGASDLDGFKSHKNRPNKLFYVVPQGMIEAKDIPDYAGLMYVNEGRLSTIKEAPFIHKEKLKFEDKLCHKFYHYWLNEKYNNFKLKQNNEYLQREVERLKAVNNIA